MLSAQMLLFDGTGRVRCSTAVAGSTYVGGTPVTALGLLALSLNAPTSYDQGLPMVGLAIAADNTPGVVVAFNQTLPLTVADRVATDEAGAITQYVAGIPRVASGAIACATPE
jgi:hypothetical protein